MSTITLFHGGNTRFQHDWREITPNKKGRWEFGVGIYLTNKRSIAESYTKGSRRLYAVSISTNATNMEDIEIDVDNVITFLRECGLSMKKIKSDYIPYINGDKVEAYRFRNLLINNNFPSTKTVKVRTFMMENGVDYSIERGFGGYVIVVINTNIITKVSKEIKNIDSEVDISPLR